MTFALVDIFAMNFDSSSEMIAPVKPTTAENASSGPMPPWVRHRLVDAEDPENDGHDHQHGDVGGEEKHDAHHDWRAP